jgi:DNA modification methylase
MIIEAYQNEGWIFWQRITIDKNPQAQAIRLKDHGLLFKTLKKDSTELSGGHPDYLLIFKKRGENAVPVTPVENGEVTAEDWIRDAHPIWYDIHESDTLNTSMARSDNDEKHLCPLQLPLIRRFMALYSNPGELVFSPFAGIGSEGVVSMEKRRRFLGIELNPNYYRVATRNLQNAETTHSGKTMFDDVPYQFNKNASGAD